MYNCVQIDEEKKMNMTIEKMEKIFLFFFFFFFAILLILILASKFGMELH